MHDLKPYFIISLAMHLSFALAIRLTPSQSKQQKDRIAKISIQETHKRVFAKLEKKKLDDTIKEHEQVVNQPENLNNKRPKNSKLLSESDTSTDKQTIKHGEQTQKTGLEDDVDQQAKQGKVDLFPRQAIDGASKSISQREKRNGLNRESSTTDAIDDVEEGNQTLLNTKAYKYAYFFNRVKDTVASRWHPQEKIRSYDPLEKKYMFKDRTTVVRVILDKDGYLMDVFVYKTSGVDFLDAEAIEAFQRCVQFPNPPEGLVVDNQVSFLFGFEVKIYGGLIRF